MVSPVFYAVMILLCCHELVARTPLCGTVNLAAIYKKPSLFVSKNQANISCKYLIRAPTGLHVKLTIPRTPMHLQFTNLTIYNATGRNFQWRPERVLAKRDEILRSGTERVFETHLIGIECERSTNSSIRFKYSATVPMHKNCGFNKYSIKRKRVLHTPGFSRTKLESGLRCTWNIRSKYYKMPIELFIKSVKTSSKQDYVEIREGGKILDRLSGTMEKQRYHANSGHVQIFLHTETSDSKGFKVIYRSLKHREY